MKPQYVKIDNDGNKWYFSNKEMTKLHREDGPAVEYVNGSKLWYRDGKYHRENGPAVELPSGSKLWYRDGHLHRDDGPACEWIDGSKHWFFNGSYLTEDQFKAQKAPCNGKTVIVDGIKYTLTIK